MSGEASSVGPLGVRLAESVNRLVDSGLRTDKEVLEFLACLALLEHVVEEEDDDEA